jgi:hypothetical protein
MGYLRKKWLTGQPPCATFLTVNKEAAVSDEPQLAGMIPLSALADFLRDHLTVEVEVYEENYSQGYVTTEVTIKLGDIVITKGSDRHNYTR